MLLQRFLTALVLAPLMLAGIYLLPDEGFRAFIGLIVALGAWEWANISGFSKGWQRVLVALVSAGILYLAHVLVPVDGLLWQVLLFIAIGWWMLASALVIVFPKGKGWLQSRALRMLVMVPVLGSFWMGLVWLKVQSESVLLLTWLMVLVWGADVGAYFAGRTFGNRKLAPQVSPGKTWAGVYGGMLVSMLISIVVALVYLPELSVLGWVLLLLLSVAVVSVSVLGDLFESLLKRNRGIKDSSALLPGHGGILDRIDSLCAATPMFVLLWFVLTIV